MNKEETNRLLKLKRVINENEDKYVESFRETYSKIIGKLNEEDFYNSMVSWFFDGNAPYYDSWLEKNWRSESWNIIEV